MFMERGARKEQAHLPPPGVCGTSTKWTVTGRWMPQQMPSAEITQSLFSNHKEIKT